ncbi:putative Oligonucleotide/oligosaccharide-binding (OB)-fold [Monocercomonoides exilis]|uniref:putative Oligonucleotide/oligosaccharide-binding (OB)-fold n=1 Tax=Monocercomonoides exilis TaxID=2049356 RepID=UPI0035597020|nr:putative Oligonucleotide/oligosaccharide-binding (OB)-fold [Monocercomonoides exilis]|eukprot:MONOS_12240.1-p1 / transcript=MONOS_12240.1 / gene=MONOS_12240 / organism=Monocercomonoides_exilis_PA203 / gene_product=probable ATP-dependent RNA helicase DHX35 isoform 2 / transcript_product=probable ATP-dependent RNA helicase DHX35 isoform 2 / location=Mono_scaffold00664:7794-11026(-) / protein_length=690 / sequence_SO=supercontig / SO=protein_coding / is_pseudo=false
MSVAEYVAKQRNSQIGQEIGFVVRHEESVTDRTMVKYVTEGILLRELLSDPMLSSYGVVMIDEVHERSTNTDILLALLKKILRKRKDMKLIVASATIDAFEMVQYFQLKNESAPTSACLFIEGRQHEVKTFYSTDPVEDYVKSAVECVISINATQPIGDILVFLTGKDDIESAIEYLHSQLAEKREKERMEIEALPLHSSLPFKQQMAIFEPKSIRAKRRVIFATNIAEASITVPNIVYVVDCGFVKLKAFDPALGISHLTPCPVSQSSAIQRAGRAGRVQNGFCYRLYTEEAFAALPAKTPGEITRCDLAYPLLMIYSLCINSIRSLDFLSPPSDAQIRRAHSMLVAVGAIKETDNTSKDISYDTSADTSRLYSSSSSSSSSTSESALSSSISESKLALSTSPSFAVTEDGLNMVQLPVGDIQTAKLLIEGAKRNCSVDIINIVAMTSVKDVFLTPYQFDAPTPFHKAEAVANAKRAFSVAEGDHISLLNLYRACEHHHFDAKWMEKRSINLKMIEYVCRVRLQLRKKFKQLGLPLKTTNDIEVIQKCICAGLFANSAVKYTKGKDSGRFGLNDEGDDGDEEGHFVTLTGGVRIDIHPNSAVFAYPPTAFVFDEIVFSTKKYARHVTAIQPSWLIDVAPNFYAERTATEAIREEALRHQQMAKQSKPKSVSEMMATGDAFMSIFSETKK